MVVERGIDKDLLLESSWISPSCVISAPTLELGERVYALTSEVSQRLREKYFG